MKLSRFAGICMVVMLVCTFVCAYGEEKLVPQERVAEVLVEGNDTVSTEVVLSKLRTRPKGVYSATDVDKDIKDLYALGFFDNISTDVSESKEGVTVRFIVVERSTIKEIVIEGCEKVRPKKIRGLLTIKAGEILDEKKLAEDLVTVSEYYEKKGYELFDIKHEIREDEATGQAIVFLNVQEGGKIRLREIAFAGNEAFTHKQLKKQMKTKTRSLLSRGIFKEERFEQDLERVVEFYRDHGYADAKIKEVKKTYTADGKGLSVTIEIIEGKRYHLGQISVQGVSVFTEKEVLDVCLSKAEDLFVLSRVRKDGLSIKDLYAEKGYIDLRLSVNTIYNAETDRIDITYLIEENQVSFINRVDVVGNTRTKDVVIRRELAVSPGDLFDTVKVRRSRERLENLGFFKSVDMSVSPSEDESKKNLLIEVEEKKTGELGFGFGYSSIDQFIGFVEIAQNNFDIKNFPHFTGDGQKLRIRAELGGKRKDYVLSFTEPWFLERRLSVGFDLYSKDRRFVSSDYDESRLGGVLRVGKSLGEYWRGKVAYKLENVKIKDVDDDASSAIKAEEGEKTVSSISLELIRDTRNSYVLPSRGSRLGLFTEIAGLGGDVDFMKYVISDSFYFPGFMDGHIVRLWGQAGLVRAYGDSDSVPIFDRFFLGGANSLRGFSYRDVGPRDENDEPVGGEVSLAASLEYTFPLFTHVRGALFFDIGNVYADSSDIDFGELVASVGPGVRIDLPIGPIKLDYGFVVLTDDNTEGEDGRFSFSMGYAH